MKEKEILIQLKLSESDFLAYHLFTLSKSKKFKRSKLISWACYSLGFLLIAFGFYRSSEFHVLSFYFAAIALIFFFFHPLYYKWRYKKHYEKHIRDNYSARFNKEINVTFKDDYIFVNDYTGESKVKLTEIEHINETKDHLFIKISSGASLIIPKQFIDNLNDLKSFFQELGIKIIDETNWKW